MTDHEDFGETESWKPHRDTPADEEYTRKLDQEDREVTRIIDNDQRTIQLVNLGLGRMAAEHICELATANGLLKSPDG